MSQVNVKGGFNAVLRVTQNNSNESLCVLQKPLLKKTENWSLQVTDFFLNKTPPINRDQGEQFRIVAFEGLSTGYRNEDYIFTPKRCYTIMEYVVQLQTFLNQFSFLFWKYGVDNVLGVTEDQEDDFLESAEDIASIGVNYTKRNWVPDEVARAVGEGDELLDEGYAGYPIICSCSLDSDMKLKFKLKPIFLANFFIVCEDHFVRRLKLPKYMFHLTITGVDGPTLALPDSLFVAQLIEVLEPNGYPPFVGAVANHILGTSTQTFESDFTVRELDERVSIDLVSTFPASRKTHVIDGKEQHEYILARFDLSNMKVFESVTVQDDAEMSTSTQITESYEAGIENLTRGNPDFESNLMLTGQLQQIHLMLYTRYLENNIFERVKTDVEDGFWHARILFSKKI